jgi:GAF domain-containing protein
MPAQRHPLVGFTLFSRHAHQFTEHTLDLVLLFALHAGTAFDNASLYHEARQLIDHLHTALATREAIGQAQGILMRRLSCDTGTAFNVLRRISQHHNVKLRKVARQIADAQQRGVLDSFLSDRFTAAGSGHHSGPTTADGE